MMKIQIAVLTVMIVLTAGLTTEIVVAEDVVSAPRFQSAGPGSVSDTQTGLIWMANDNRADIDWNKSTEYCNDLVLDKSSDWRLPTLDNLKAIFDRHAYGPPLSVKISGSNTWSMTRDDSESAFYFNFNAGFDGSFPLESKTNLRVLCVRGAEVEEADPGS